MKFVICIYVVVALIYLTMAAINFLAGDIFFGWTWLGGYFAWVFGASYLYVKAVLRR